MLKVSAHIDGFNLYHAINEIVKLDPNKSYLKWVNYKGLVSEFIDPSKEIIEKVYFYSASPKHKPKDILDRHTAFTKAQIANGVEYIEGQFKKKYYNNQKHHEEKETDVNIAINLVKDAYENLSDKILLITNDSDIAPAIRMAINIRPGLKISVITPPLAGGRTPNFDLQQSARQFVKVGNKIYRKPKVIKEVHLKSHLLKETYNFLGEEIKRPSEYSPPAN